MKRNIILFIAVSAMIPGQVIGQTANANQSENSSTGLIVLLAFGLLILMVLTLWLLRNSYRLKQTIENTEANGKVWLNNHLKDLDTHQLDILIKRHPLMSNTALKDEKPNE
jgi:hypothetical protein